MLHVILLLKLVHLKLFRCHWIINIINLSQVHLALIFNHCHFLMICWGHLRLFLLRLMSLEFFFLLITFLLLIFDLRNWLILTWSKLYYFVESMTVVTRVRSLAGNLLPIKSREKFEVKGVERTSFFTSSALSFIIFLRNGNASTSKLTTVGDAIDLKVLESFIITFVKLIKFEQTKRWNRIWMNLWRIFIIVGVLVLLWALLSTTPAASLPPLGLGVVGTSTYGFIDGLRHDVIKIVVWIFFKVRLLVGYRQTIMKLENLRAILLFLNGFVLLI